MKLEQIIFFIWYNIQTQHICACCLYTQSVPKHYYTCEKYSFDIQINKKKLFAQANVAKYTDIMIKMFYIPRLERHGIFLFKMFHRQITDF